MDRFTRLPVLDTRLQYQMIYPFGRRYTDIRGTREMSCRTIPLTQGKVADARQAYELACLPGIKTIAVRNAAEANYLLTYIMGTALNTFKPAGNGKNSVILATGGTWEGPRFFFGDPVMALKLHGMALPTDKGLVFTCLDEYDYQHDYWNYLCAKLGTADTFTNARQLPISYGDEHRTFLLPAGFSEKDFRFPPVGYDCTGFKAGEKWRQTLKQDIYPAILCAHGLGTNPYHDAFNDHGDFWSPTGIYEIAGGTKLQNVNNFVPPNQLKVSMMFRNIAGSFQGMSTIRQVFSKARTLLIQFSKDGLVPRELKHYVSIEEWSGFMLHLDEHIERAVEMTSLMPSYTLTQSLSDLADGGGVGMSAELHAIGVVGGQKSLGYFNCLEQAPSSGAPASAVNFYGRAIVVADQKALHHSRQHNHLWHFMPDGTTGHFIDENFGQHTIEHRFWDSREARMKTPAK